MQVELLPHQFDLITDNESKMICLAGGYGSGKTAGAIHWAISRGFENAGLTGLWIEPTYQLVKRVAIPDIKAQLEAMEIPYIEHVADMALTIGPKGQTFKIYFHSGQQPERIVGQSVAWAVIDEAALVSEMVFRNVLARVRHPESKSLQICCVSTPEGRNWLWNKFENEPALGSRLIRAKTADNPHLPAEYLDHLKEQYTDSEFEQYCQGHFIAKSGTVYRLDRDRHFAQCQDPMLGEIVIGADFNIAKMAWCLASVDGETLHVFDEHIGYNRTTQEQAELLDDRLRILFRQAGLRYETRRITIYCDASGASRKTSASRSDVAILRSFGWRVRHNPANPLIRDRVSSVNAKLKNGTLLIDNVKAKYFAKCIEQQSYDAAGQPEKGDLDHGSDALGYAVAQLWPIRSISFKDYKYH